MAEMLEETGSLESPTIGIYRTAATVKGGRRFSFGALVAVGDRNGQIALGYGKAPGVPAAIEKAQKSAKKNLHTIVRQGRTIPHEVTGRFGAAVVRLIPASPGTGVIAGGTVRAVLEMAGINDCLTKSYGSNNQKNLCKATMQGLLALRSKEEVARLREVELPETLVDEKLARGSAFVTIREETPSTKPKEERDRGRGGKGRGRGGPGKGRGKRQGRRDSGPRAAEKPGSAQPKAQAGESAPPAEPKTSDTPAGETDASGETAKD